VKGPPSSSSRDKVTKSRRGKERVEWGRGPWRAVLAFLPRGPRVPSYATVYKVHFHRLQVAIGHKASYVTLYSNITYKNTSTKTYISASYNTFLAGYQTLSLQFVEIDG